MLKIKLCINETVTLNGPYIDNLGVKRMISQRFTCEEHALLEVASMRSEGYEFSLVVIRKV